MRRRVLSVVLGMGAAVALGSCATLNAAECTSGDWASIGRRDGGEGLPMSRLADHAKACAKHGVVPDQQAYAMGRDEGLMGYCTPPSGFLHGRQGDGYAGVCPGGLEQAFRAGYRDGQAVNSIMTRLHSLESQREARRHRADEIRGQIEGEEKKLAAAKTPEEAKAIRDHIRDLRIQRQQALNEVDGAEDELDDARRAADNARAQFTPIYGPF